jgi:Tol biopolymer transport system component
MGWLRVRVGMAIFLGGAFAIVGVTAGGGEVVAATPSASPAVPRVPQVFVVGADGRNLRQVTSGPSSHSGVLWLPGAASVADITYLGYKAWIESQRIDGSGRRDLSAIVSSPNTQAQLVFSPASKLTAIETYNESTSTETLARVGAPGSQRKVLDSWPDYDLGPEDVPAWSPNGRLIAYARSSGPVLNPSVGPVSTGPVHIRIVAPDGHRRRALTHGTASDGPPLFSPDGRSILFYASTGHQGAFYTTPARGGPVHKVARVPFSSTVAWSPNGREIAYTGYRNHGQFPYLFVMNLHTGHVRKLANSVQLLTPAWSPDGKEIAFATWPTPPVPEPKKGYAAVETIHPDGTQPRVLVSAPNSETLDLAWSHDGKQIAFTLGPAPRGD